MNKIKLKRKKNIEIQYNAASAKFIICIYKFNKANSEKDKNRIASTPIVVVFFAHNFQNKKQFLRNSKHYLSER